MKGSLFNFNRNNQLSVVPIVDDIDHGQQIAWWLNGRILGRYVSVRIPWRRRSPR